MANLVYRNGQVTASLPLVSAPSADHPGHIAVRCSDNKISYSPLQLTAVAAPNNKVRVSIPGKGVAAPADELTYTTTTTQPGGDTKYTYSGLYGTTGSSTMSRFDKYNLVGFAKHAHSISHRQSISNGKLVYIDKYGYAIASHVVDDALMNTYLNRSEVTNATFALRPYYHWNFSFNDGAIFADQGAYAFGVAAPESGRFHGTAQFGWVTKTATTTIPAAQSSKLTQWSQLSYWSNVNSRYVYHYSSANSLLPGDISLEGMNTNLTAAEQAVKYVLLYDARDRYSYRGTNATNINPNIGAGGKKISYKYFVSQGTTTSSATQFTAIPGSTDWANVQWTYSSDPGSVVTVTVTKTLQ